MTRKSLLLLLLTTFCLALTSWSFAAAVDKKGIKLNKIMTDNNVQEFDVNRIWMQVTNNNLFACHPLTQENGLEYPKGSGILPIFTAGTWIGGLTHETKKLRMATGAYATDCQAGLILPSGAPDDPTKTEYRVFKFNKGDVIPAEAIAQGCPATVMGDQMLYCVYNDANPTLHAATFLTEPIGLEVRQTVWGYAQSGSLGDCVFMKFEFVNKGSEDLDSTYVGIFFDPDLGDATDDYVACDRNLSLGYCYNGDANDANYYGLQPPAFGCDFFQGPMVDSPGDTAYLPSGKVPDKKILPMTSFAKYINQNAVYSDPDYQTAGGANQAYNYLQGLIWDGSPFINPYTNLESKFVNDGDPVTGAGWLGYWEAPPGDHRMLVNSGPFELKRNQPIEVVVGLVFGLGNNYLNSISVMKYNDKVAQFAYDNNFIVGSPPPAPVVKVFEGDEEINLTWDDTAASFADDAGYAFEGYNVYQAPSLSGDAYGKWKLIATFDKKNYVTKIYDDVFDESADAIVTKPVQFGTDAGERFDFLITKDYYNGGVPLVNGKKYYFAVTAYSQNPGGTPKALENSISAIVCIPHKPELRTQLNAATTQAIAMTVNPGDGKVAGDVAAKITVVDPNWITGHDYKIIPVFATSGPDSGYANTWSLFDVTANKTVIEKYANYSGDNAYPAVDGIKAVVTMPKPGAYGINLTKGDGGSRPGLKVTGTRSMTGVNSGLETFYGGGGIGENFQGSTLTGTDFCDVKIYFSNDQTKWTKAYVYKRPGYTFKGIGTFPGWAEDITNPANPRRLNIAFLENEGSNAVDMKWNPIEADLGDGLGGREYLWIMNSSYSDGAPLYDDANNARSSDVLYAFWMKAYDAATRPSTSEWTMTVYAWHPVKAGDNITFTTKDLNNIASDEIGKARLDDISVFPNPYWGLNQAETTTFGQFVSFLNLPKDECTLRIFTLSGQLVKTIQHTNQTALDQWNIKNDSGVPVGSGVYLVHIEVPNVGSKVLKLAVVNREARYLHY